MVVDSVKVKKTSFDSFANTVNQFSAFAKASASKIGSISSNWTTYVPSLKAGSVSPASKGSSASSLPKRQPSYLPKAAALLALPVLGVVAWSLKSAVSRVQTPGGQGQLQPDDLLKNQLTHSRTENGTADLEACGPLSSGLVPCAPFGQEQIQPDDLFVVQLTSTSADESRMSSYIESGSLLDDTVVQGIKKPITAETSVRSADLPSWEKEGFSLASAREMYTNRTDVPAASPKFCPSVTREMLQELDKQVKEKKNFREAFDAVYAATDKVLEMRELANGQCSGLCFELLYDSCGLLTKLMEYDQFHSQILEIAKKWAQDPSPSFNIYSKDIMLKFLGKGIYYNETFEIAKSIQYFADDLYKALAEKDAFLVEIFDITKKNIPSRDFWFGSVLAQLIGKGIGREYAVEWIAGSASSYNIQCLKVLTETPEKLMETAQLFLNDSSLHKHAVPFFKKVCDSKLGCPQARDAIRKILPSIKDQNIVSQLENLLNVSWYYRMIGY